MLLKPSFISAGEAFLMLRRIDGLVAVLLLAALATGAALIGRLERVAGAIRVAGAVRVVDGDTIELAGRRIRLLGIDAPEMDQTCGEPGRTSRCGEEARDALRALIGSQDVGCAVAGRDKWGRDLAACDAGGIDLGAALVRGGHAVAYGRYLSEEREARLRRIGIWAGPFELPSRWRSAHVHRV